MRPELSVSSSEAYSDVLAKLVADRVASKLSERDPTLWGPEAEAEASIRLSWVTLPRSSRALLTELDALRAQLWSEDIDRVVLCGMGGSSLAPEVISRSYGVPLDILDSTHPSAVSRALSDDLSRTAVVVSSKSGGTVETDSQRLAFEAAFRAAGIDPAARFVVVTDPGSDLEKLATSAGYRKVFTADPHVGGRYSALTAFGLVPSALAGVDIADLLDEAEDEMDRLAQDSPANPALVLAAAIAANPGRDKLVIADAGSGIVGFGDWAEQLIAESTGKQGLGVLPVAVEGVHAPEIQRAASDVITAVLTPGAVDEDSGTAPHDIDGPWVNVSGTLGAQFLLWETATAIAGHIIGINPFDQPDVESAKKAARGLLDAQPASEPAVLTSEGIEVRGSSGLLDGVASLTGAIDALLSRLGDDGYLAVMAYLDSHRDRALHGVRETLARRTGRPTTFGWGPRFLHSTGQYHKGGPAQGVFLQVTSSEPVDLEVPDRPFSFGALIAAQAAGDATVLADHGLPVLRLHLLQPESGIPALVKLLG